jgi:hypothetical protein
MRNRGQYELKPERLGCKMISMMSDNDMAQVLIRIERIERALLKACKDYSLARTIQEDFLCKAWTEDLFYKSHITPYKSEKQVNTGAKK